MHQSVKPADSKCIGGSMSQDQPGNHEALQNLAHLLREQHPEEPKAPAVTDRHILAAMLGKPWWGDSDKRPAEVRKAG
jgi:hypothetical protein